jgi:hypothetical protein
LDPSPRDLHEPPSVEDPRGNVDLDEAATAIDFDGEAAACDRE